MKQKFKLAKNLGGLISKNSPILLSGLAVGGLVTTAVLAVKATPKAMKLLEESEVKDRKDAIKVAWKCYVPAASVGLGTILCIIGLNSVHNRRNAALASVYTLTEKAFTDYREKVSDMFGKNKELKVRDDISADKVKAMGDKEVIITGNGDMLCYDDLSGRYFKSNIEKIRKIVNDLNREALYEDFMTLNEFYYALGLSQIKLGNDLGWFCSDHAMEVTFSSQLTETGEPCIVLNYSVKPRYF